MADHQRVHPVIHDPESSPPPKASAPLFPQEVSRSEKGDPESQTYPPIHRTIPYSYSKPPKRKCCKRCFCWTVFLIILQIILVAILAAIIYFAFKPKLPKYSVDSMRITQFNVGNDNSLSATFNVNITARNPNKKIGIYYEGGSHLSVFYNGNKLCEGSLPKFYQGHRNTTVMQVSLTGQTQDARGLIQSVQAQQQQTGKIPLNLRAKVPVRIKLGGLKLMKWKFLVKCKVNVDSLRQDNTISISDSSCKFRFRF
ncbi:OLC1v1010358C1 [Oldenlandia corymbosa var. corymbosa]|uniref:OLC1v1010358C1 n=1 Tax=Oldenlandia corymbosa var. corymbosa TaxID=529605 RepID=A0AAV1DTV9_OLDCO|nr:OLC1v1010358C1 [Oldenlandia corymbosa var. corymbosa]